MLIWVVSLSVAIDTLLRFALVQDLQIAKLFTSTQGNRFLLTTGFSTLTPPVVSSEWDLALSSGTDSQIQVL